MEDYRLPKQLLNYHPKGRRRPGRPLKRLLTGRREWWERNSPPCPKFVMEHDDGDHDDELINWTCSNNRNRVFCFKFKHLRISSSVAKLDKINCIALVTVHLERLLLNFYYSYIDIGKDAVQHVNSRVSLLRLTQITSRQRLWDVYNYNVTFHLSFYKCSVTLIVYQSTNT
jgi:hypothetical protein